MPEAVMTLQYEGPAVDSGAMDVRQLAPALIATADVMRAAHALLNVPGPSPQVNIQATRPGSFIVDLQVADPGIGSQILGLLVSRGADGAVNLGAMVTLVVSSIGAVRWLRNRKIARTERPTPDLVRIVIDDSTTLEIRPEALRLMMDAGYRRALRAMVEPLTGDQGIRRLTVNADDQGETVASADVPAFDVPPATEEDLGESVSEVVLRPVNVAFTEGNKWRFNDGETTFHAAIDDIGFLSRVDAGTEWFAKNDMLRVRLRTRQRRDAEGLHTERTVTEVLDHLSGAVQLDLFADVDRPPSAQRPDSN
jgi:hypothetical protein